ncbi:MAG: hypothetical protein A2Y56_01135 [Candidatus Aminicenantes bacterium RBG_13_63_10]|nr:MAG: hypothetical protein A2Y56_01135 [Candidatus Aminicenantes bacterium RBG_13_63_10]
MQLTKTNRWLLLFLFGSLWGIMEVVGGESFFKNAVPQASAALSAWGLLMLAAARAVWNRPGTSALVGALAALFKLINAAPFYCHLAGIVILALAFDLMVTVLARKLRPLGGVLAGITTPFVANTAFGIFMAFIVKYKYWAVEGWPKVIKHIVVSGGLAALAGAVLVPLGFWLGNNIEALNLRKPRWALAGAMMGTAAVWTAARIFG